MTTTTHPRTRTTGRRRTPRAAGRALSAVGAVLLLLSGAGLAVTTPPALADEAAPGGPTESAMTLNGPAGTEFEDLSVTVSKTEDLINEAITVSWTGGAETRGPGIKPMGVNYLQIMQCWGDSPQGPERDQCQWGSSEDLTGGDKAWLRDITRHRNSPGVASDPLEEYYTEGPLAGQLRAGVGGISYGSAEADADPGTVPNVTPQVRFRPASGAEPSLSSYTNPYYNRNTTNEIAFGRTAADGTGLEHFEVQTDREATGLGCGEEISAPGGGTTPRNCWLVVVPRGEHEVDGTYMAGDEPSSILHSSPLSLSNWQHRLVFPLSFRSVESACELGADERRMTGSELVAEATVSWQAHMCRTTDTVYGYTSNADGVARSTLASTSDSAPGMAFATEPLDPAMLPEGQRVSYAPVALSGATVAFNIVVNPALGASEEITARRGQYMERMRLTPRLVAKLLTQFYRSSSPGGSDYLRGNPEHLFADPEFQAINPHFAGLTGHDGAADMVVSIARTDAVTALWRWIDADPDARAWLDGEPDPAGYVVNPTYLEMALPQDGIPKNDPGCQPRTDLIPIPLCLSNWSAYVDDFREAAYYARRGDNNRNASWEPQPPQRWKAMGPQARDKHLVITFTDTASAHRYGLQTAELLNAAGEYVAPTEESLRAGVAAMVDSPVPGVRQVDPEAEAEGAYPLTMLTYAGVNRTRLDDRTRGEYADFLEYAVGDGQVPGVREGQLPPGYVPLPEAEVEQAMATVECLRDEDACPDPVEPGGDPTPGDGSPPPGTGGSSPAGGGDGGAAPQSVGGAGAGTTGGTGGGSTGAGGGDGAAAGGGSPSPSTAPAATGPDGGEGGTTAATTVAQTPANPLGRLRLALWICAVTGALAVVAGPILTRLARETASGTLAAAERPGPRSAAAPS
ncbi:hypothetical protein [Allostreptomyces psammosilenae]|uniref:PBP domain-containing protein n=1 Tax=Allostreptomyces psammosilenae TaxID=1892865 RepID=A0A853A755_9ACTN|nr:hypothetical protein [Allostreptomyces psammosilenae]NYI06282.1 hypothetical protein [Allostreptomyces psammosilenae]